MGCIIGIIVVVFLSFLLVISLCKAASDMDDYLEDIKHWKIFRYTFVVVWASLEKIILKKAMRGEYIARIH